MSKAIFNLEALESVKVHRRKLFKGLIWLPYEKSFWNGTRKEGFYLSSWLYRDEHSRPPYAAEGLRKGDYLGIKMLVDGKNVYDKPYVTLTFVSGDKRNKTFDTYEEAEAWAKEQANKGINVQLQLP